jgi:NAD(P)-dependent dehydrogenase (short-subunit alcohol dehydrogenase family)
MLRAETSTMIRPRVLVTGGGRGIGRAIALEFAAHGARVVVSARSVAEIEAVVAEIRAAGGEGHAIALDVTDEESVEHGLQIAGPLTGGELDVLVNNAGVFDVAPIEDLPVANWRAMLEVNLTGAFLMTRRALPALRTGGGGHIFNIASTAARQGFSDNTAYCAGKYGLRGFGDALREELREAGIRVTTVYPGATDTTIFDGVPGDWDRSTMNRPEDVAQVVREAYVADDPPGDLLVPPPTIEPVVPS